MMNNIRSTESLITAYQELEETLESSKEKLEEFRDESGNLSKEGLALEASISKSEISLIALYEILSKLVESPIDKRLNELGDSVEGLRFEKATKKAQELSNQLNNTTDGVNQLGKSAEELQEVYDATNKEIDSYQSNLKEVSSIYEQVNNQEKLSSMQLLDLTQKISKIYITNISC